VSYCLILCLRTNTNMLCRGNTLLCLTIYESMNIVFTKLLIKAFYIKNYNNKNNSNNNNIYQQKKKKLLFKIVKKKKK